MPQCSFQPQLVCETILFPHVDATGSFQGGNLCQMNGLLSFLNGKYLGKSLTQIQNSGEDDLVFLRSIFFKVFSFFNFLKNVECDCQLDLPVKVVTD